MNLLEPSRICARQLFPSTMSEHYKNGKVVIVEGLIGSGKSTLVRTLKRRFSMNGLRSLYTRCVVLVEDIVPSLLDLYIGDMSKYAFSFQVIVARNRCEMMRAAVTEARQGAIVFIDRGLPGDIAFALMHRQENNISAEEYEVYKDMISDAHPEFVPFALQDRAKKQNKKMAENAVSIVILYLECQPEVAFARMLKRCNASEVAGYTLEYFERLTKSYNAIVDQFEAANARNVCVKRVDYNRERKFDCENLLQEADCNEILQLLR